MTKQSDMTRKAAERIIHNAKPLTGEELATLLDQGPWDCCQQAQKDIYNNTAAALNARFASTRALQLADSTRKVVADLVAAVVRLYNRLHRANVSFGATETKRLVCALTAGRKLLDGEG